MLTQKKLTQKRLKEILHYDPNTGIFTWIQGPMRQKQAGYKNPAKCIDIRIFGRLRKAHRLAWLYIHGFFPENQIDHIDRNPLNNKIDNLREVSCQCNIRNCGNFINTSTAAKGVCWHKSGNKWRANIVINNKQKSLGLYVDFDNAVCARLAGEQACNWSGCDSNSPAYQYVQRMLSHRL